jgi:hypothetical protein
MESGGNGSIVAEWVLWKWFSTARTEGNARVHVAQQMDFLSLQIVPVVGKFGSSFFTFR